MGLSTCSHQRYRKTVLNFSGNFIGYWACKFLKGLGLPFFILNFCCSNIGLAAGNLSWEWLEAAMVPISCLLFPAEKDLPVSITYCFGQSSNPAKNTPDL